LNTPHLETPVHSDQQQTSRATGRLTNFAASLRFEDVPAGVADHVRWLLLDTLGVSLAATTLGSGCREVIEVMRRLGGKPESTILGYPDKLSAPHAAFANGALAHALNYDPIGARVGHVGIVCLVAPLVIAEAMGVVSGRQFLTAATVAAEVTARITAAAARNGRKLSNRILAGQLLSYFGAVAGAGRMLGLTAGQMRSAFGLALMQASGSMQVVLGGEPPAKAIYGAFPNHGAVLAALLGAAGLGADCDALEGVAGLYETYFGGDYDPSTLIDGLGTEYLLLATRFKLWPTSDAIYPFIQAAMEIHRNGTATSDIAEVKISGPAQLRPWCETSEERRRPENAAAAANSVPFCVAKTLSNGDVRLDDFAPRGLADEVALGIAGRTTYAGAELSGTARVEVRITSGRLLSAEVPVIVGEQLPIISHDRLLGKFRDCCRYAATPLSTEDVLDLINLVENLEQVENVAILPAIAGGQRKHAAEKNR
jgi:2-methylcitrate dehydratase PrpD